MCASFDSNVIAEHAARFYAAEVLSALEYLHMMGFIYRGTGECYYSRSLSRVAVFVLLFVPAFLHLCFLLMIHGLFYRRRALF